MATNTFNTPAGQTVKRELMIAYLNTGTESAPVWSPFGKRVTDSSIEYDWSEETSQDNRGLPMIRESIRGRAAPVLEESSGRNMTAEEPAIANRNLSVPRGGGGIKNQV